MQEFKGTPGPWVSVDYCGKLQIQAGEYYEDADILDKEDVGDEIAEANASLIEAAPELLAALKVFTDDYKSGYRIMTPNMISQAQQAINKALNTK